MMDIRKRLKEFFDQYSHDIVYVRRDPRFKCYCFVERSGEPKADCDECFGTGNVVKVERMRGRRQISSVPETLVGVNQLQMAGRIAPTAYVYYLEHHTNPNENDLIMEVVWDTKGVPRLIKEKHLISAVDPKFGYKGRVEFYQVYARYDQKGANDDTTLSKH